MFAEIDLNFKQISTIFGILGVVISSLIYLQIIEPYQIYFNKNLIVHNHEYWRLFTSLFYFGPLDFSTIISIYFFVHYTSTIETVEFPTKPADFLLFILIGCFASWCYALYTEKTFLGDFLSDYIFFYYCKKQPDLHILILFFPFPMRLGVYPFYRFISDFIFGRNIFQDFLPFILSHTYFFIHDVCSIKYERNYLKLSDKINEVINSIFSDRD